MQRSSLTELANKYGTDKGTIGPTRGWDANNYTDIYASFLERYRESAINLLEIGLGVKGPYWESRIVQGKNSGGASARMWYDYFPNGKIFGIDINECSYLDNDRISTFAADQGKQEDLDRFLNMVEVDHFDLIIDDGSHRPDEQQFSLGYLFKYLLPGGHYFIEDLSLNGLEDGRAGRSASKRYQNTRSVLKYYQAHGRFLEPNNLVNHDYLMNNIAYIGFYCPKVSFRLSYHARRRSRIRMVRSYQPDSERLCVLVKK